MANPPRHSIASPSLVVLAAFTPYLGFALGLRVEHVLIYGFVAYLALVRPTVSLGAVRELRQVIVPWLILSLLVLRTFFIRLTDLQGIVDFSVVERMLRLGDSFFLQLTALLLAYVLAAPSAIGIVRQFRSAVWLYLVLMSGNALLGVLFDPLEIQATLRWFWANPNAPFQTDTWGSVAARELSAGRFGGIFNQPFDGGLAYSYALVGWWYLFGQRRLMSPRVIATGLTMLLLLLTGGFNTGSKVFLGALLIVPAHILLTLSPRFGRSFRRSRLLAVFLLGSLGVASIGFIESSRIWDFIGSIGVQTTVLSAGRFSSPLEWLTLLMQEFSLAGRADFDFYYSDDAFRAYMSAAGVVGVAAFLATFRGFRAGLRSLRGTPEAYVGSAFVLLTLIACLGMVALQANRASTIFWGLMGLLLRLSKVRRQSRPHQADVLPHHAASGTSRTMNSAA